MIQEKIKNGQKVAFFSVSKALPWQLIENSVNAFFGRLTAFKEGVHYLCLHRELQLSNGVTLHVGTSMRSSTLQLLHISEFGKICAKFPNKARQIVTGSLNALAPGQYVFIESTAEGREGYFYR